MTDSPTFADTLRRFEARATDWFKEAHEYTGAGEATFSTNPGVLRGPATIKVGPDGELEGFSIKVENMDVETDPSGGLPLAVHPFVNGLPAGEAGTFTIGGSSNTCTSVVVRGDGYVVEIDQDDIIASGSMDGTVSFQPYRTVVRYDRASAAKYWAAPLINFGSKFYWAMTALQGHPLRLRRTEPFEPQNETNDWADWAYRQENALIPFDSAGSLGFIEPLIDYDERIERIKSERSPVITAVMIGNVGDTHDAKMGYPSDLIPLLGLATGWRVSAPWVELRDAEGLIVSRTHAVVGSPTYKRGMHLFQEFINRSTGTFLSAYLGSPYNGSVVLRVAVAHLLRAMTGDMTVEDRLGHLFRSAEGLAVGLKLDKPRPLELSDQSREAVEKLLDDCAAGLQELADSHPDDADRIMQLRGRMIEFKKNRPSLHAQIQALVEHAHLNDAEWLADFSYRAKQSPTLVPWYKAASQYRNKIFHDAFIDFESTFDLNNAVIFLHHFTDVLVRVVFSLIGFEGTYRPACGWHGMTAHREEPGWATPDKLGDGSGLRYQP